MVLHAPAPTMSMLEGSQVEMMRWLRQPDSPHAEMLVALLMTNCLLELSKLVTQRLCLADFAHAAVGCLAHFAPIDGCALALNPVDLPAVLSRTGAWPDVGDGELADPVAAKRFGVCTHPIVGPTGAVVGYLGMSGAPEALIEAGLVERGANQISDALALLVDAERLRRSAAAAHAVDLVTVLEDGYGEVQLAEIADALQMLPGAVAARVKVEIPRMGGPLEVQAGIAATVAATREMALDRRGALTVDMWWSETEPADSRCGEIIDRLSNALNRIEQTHRLIEEVETDALTGVGNRRRASRAMAQARSRSERSAEEFAVLMLDLDQFKTVNDSLGHDVGDAVLVSFAAALGNTVRGYDVVCRWGGEEFIIVCPITNALGASELAKRLLAATPASCAHLLPEGWRQTVSIGIAIHPYAASNPAELLRAADTALYAAKSSGRDCCVIGGAHPKGVVRPASIEAKGRSAASV